MANPNTLRAQRADMFDLAEKIINTARANKRDLQDPELSQYHSTIAVIKDLDQQIAQAEKVGAKNAPINPGGPLRGNSKSLQLSRDYQSAFLAYVHSSGRKIEASLYEGADSAGGFAVPIEVDGVIVPLAGFEMGIRKLATVLPTESDLKIPIQATHASAAAKAESGASDHAFNDSNPTLAQVTLSAFMGGVVTTASLEAVQDITTLQNFILSDLLIALQQYEEPLFISGTGSGQPQGVLTGADVGVTITGAHAVQGVITLDSLYDLVASLNAFYHPNAAWLMRRSTGLAIRKLQRTANLFEPVFTSSNGRDYLLGYPVEYSASIPDGTTDQDKPIVFGDFSRGFVIGDRGGSGIRIKVLDQPKATLGQIQFLAYRRTDSRVRRTEALKALKLATGA